MEVDLETLDVIAPQRSPRCDVPKMAFFSVGEEKRCALRGSGGWCFWTKRWTPRLYTDLRSEVIFATPFLRLHAGFSGRNGRSDVQSTRAEEKIHRKACWATFQSDHHFLSLSFIDSFRWYTNCSSGVCRYTIFVFWGLDIKSKRLNSVHGWWKSLVE